MKRILLKDLDNLVYSSTGLERALELPFGTIKGWKTNPETFTPECVALVKFIILYPWLIEVADENYYCRM